MLWMLPSSAGVGRDASAVVEPISCQVECGIDWSICHNMAYDRVGGFGSNRDTALSRCYIVCSSENARRFACDIYLMSTETSGSIISLFSDK